MEYVTLRHVLSTGSRTRKIVHIAANYTYTSGHAKLCSVITSVAVVAVALIAVSHVGLPDLPYFPGAPVFQPVSPVSRTEAKISRI